MPSKKRLKAAFCCPMKRLFAVTAMFAVVCGVPTRTPLTYNSMVVPSHVPARCVNAPLAIVAPVIAGTTLAVLQIAKTGEAVAPASVDALKYNENGAFGTVAPFVSFVTMPAMLVVDQL